MQTNKIVAVELSHEHTPIHIREKIRLNRSGIDSDLYILDAKMEEVFVLSTCNRYAIYAWSKNPKSLLDYFPQDVRPYLIVYSNSHAAARHLFETAGGVRSQVLGEHQILGQIRKAHTQALQTGCIGPVLDQLVREAIRIGKRIRTETPIGKYAASVVTSGFELVKLEYLDFSEKGFLVIGTGKIASLTLDLLQKVGAKKIYVAGHNLEKAQKVASFWNVQPLDLNDIHEKLDEIDVMIGGTHEEINFFSLEEKTMHCPRANFGSSTHKKLLLIDFGMPRNFNPALKNHPNIKLFDLDDIKKCSERAVQRRMTALPAVEEIIDQEVQNFLTAHRQQKLAPVLGAYWKRLEQLKEENLHWLMPKIGDIDENQQKLIRRFSHKLIRSIAREPLQNLRDWAKESTLPKAGMETLKNLYKLEVDENRKSRVESIKNNNH